MQEFTEITSASKVEKRLLEIDIQSACVKWARARGYWCRKFASPANRSVPDYIFSGKNLKFFTEFKAPRKTPTENQIEEQKLMADAGWHGFNCDDIDKFKIWVLSYENANT